MHSCLRRSILVLAAAGMATASGSPVAADGRGVYLRACAACHAAGTAGAPRLGDTRAWAPRREAGAGVLDTSVLRGKGAMPPKGGNASLTDEDVRAALAYMLSRVE
ncbi:MAG TPA: c-type cytochrome [Rhodocyclaceae bacterium]|nr:c-type cytochrome [Rhodocyclaceae bacterium]